MVHIWIFKIAKNIFNICNGFVFFYYYNIYISIAIAISQPNFYFLHCWMFLEKLICSQFLEIQRVKKYAKLWEILERNFLHGCKWIQDELLAPAQVFQQCEGKWFLESLSNILWNIKIFTYLFTILSGRATSNSQRPRNEIVLDVNN